MRVIYGLTANVLSAALLIWTVWTFVDDLRDIWTLYGGIWAAVALVLAPATFFFSPLLIWIVSGNWGQVLATYIIFPVLYLLEFYFDHKFKTYPSPE